MFGLFDWVYDLLYGISKSMYAIIDNLLACANMLCGIEPITYQGAEMDFMTFLLKNPTITYAFVGSVLIATVVVVIFGIIMIIRSIASEKIQKTPAQIALSIAKTVLTFLFIPAAMVILILLTNMLMKILYSTTLGGSPDGLGRFLAGAFGQNGLKGGVPTDFYLSSDFNYMKTSSIKKFVDLSDYDFFFSYLTGIILIISIGFILLMFVDRAISIVVLYIFAPLSLATAVLDDGARFKLWRDQFLTKFLTGYGCIIAINIYAIIVLAITNDNLKFFDNTILNNVMKIIIVLGGGVSLQRMMSLVGNLITAGGGSNELRDAAIANHSFGAAVAGGFGVAKGPFRATRGAVNFVRDAKNTGFSTAVGRALGFKTSRDYQIEQNRVAGRGGSSVKSGGNNSNQQASAGAKEVGGGGNNAKIAIQGKNNGGAASGGPSVINNNAGAAKNNQGSNMVSNSVSNALNNANNDKGNK